MLGISPHRQTRQGTQRVLTGAMSWTESGLSQNRSSVQQMPTSLSSLQNLAGNRVSVRWLRVMACRPNADKGSDQRRENSFQRPSELAHLPTPNFGAI